MVLEGVKISVTFEGIPTEIHQTNFTEDWRSGLEDGRVWLNQRITQEMERKGQQEDQAVDLSDLEVEQESSSSEDEAGPAKRSKSIDANAKK